MTVKMKIVVPVYNAQEWIKDCIDSIADQLKLSRGSIIRQAIDEFLESKSTDKKTKK